jgi:hypothetical protein
MTIGCLTVVFVAMVVAACFGAVTMAVFQINRRETQTMTEKDAYRHACAMEDPLQRIRNFTAALARLAPTIDDEQAAAIMQQLTAAIRESLDQLDDIHGHFFRLHHPDRERFEREGWPSEQATEAADA